MQTSLVYCKHAKKKKRKKKFVDQVTRINPLVSQGALDEIVKRDDFKAISGFKSLQNS